MVKKWLANLYLLIWIRSVLDICPTGNLHPDILLEPQTLSVQLYSLFMPQTWFFSPNHSDFDSVYTILLVFHLTNLGII